MTDFVNTYSQQLITSGILFLTLTIIRFIIIKLIVKYAVKSDVIESRKNLIIKYVSVFFTTLFLIGLLTVWGVQKEDLFFTISSILTVVGVALFAQWSILSNVTSGLIILFSFPFKIGDTIKIHDKDFPMEGEIISIHTFYTYLKTLDGELVTYPNSLLLQKGISVMKQH